MIMFIVIVIIIITTVVVVVTMMMMMITMIIIVQEIVEQLHLPIGDQMLIVCNVCRAWAELPLT